MALDRGTLEELRRALERTARELKTATRGLSTTPDFGSDVDGLEEEAEETDALGVNLGVADVFKARLRRVEKALGKIRAGGYGTCERCGAEIPADFLRVDPESERCKTCKAKR